MGLFHKIGKFFSSTVGSFALLALSITPLAPVSIGFRIAAAAAALIGSYAAAKYQQSLLRDSFKKVGGGGYLVNTRSPQEQIPVVYGRCRVGINWIWAATSGKNNEYLYVVGSLCEGPIQGVEELWLDGKPLVGIKETEKTEGKIVRQIVNAEVNKIKLSVEYPRYIDNFGEKYFGGNITEVLEITRGESVDKGTYTVTFSADGTITVEGKQIDSVCVKWGYQFDEWGNVERVCKETRPVYQRINRVSFLDYSTDGGQAWFKSPTDLVEWDFVRGDEINFAGKSGGLFDEIRNLGFTDNVPYTACVVVRLKWATQKVDNVIQPRWSGVPNITAVVNGRDIDDRGTGFKKNNPALILLDYLTNPRYGLGIPENKIDVESFLEVAQYCEEQGFSFDGVVVDGSAKDVVELLCNHFRGILIKSGGKYRLRYKNLFFEAPVMKFTDEDFIDGSFSVELPSRTRIPNSIEIDYIDPVLNDTPNTLTLEVPDEITTEENPLKLKLYGVDRLGAKRLGAYFLERARLNYTIAFTTTSKGLPLEPGDIISVSYSDYGIENQLFRVEEVRQIDEDSVSITAILEDYCLYNEDIDLDLASVDITSLPDPNDPPPPVIPELSELTELDKDGTPMSYILVNWEDSGGTIDHYEVWVNGELAGITKAPPYRILVKAGETYSVKVIPVTIFGIKADWDSSPAVSLTVSGITEGPSWGGGITVSIDNTKKVATLSWSKTSDKDFDHFEVNVYKKSDGSLLDSFFTSSTRFSISLVYEDDIEIGVKAVNTSGVASQEEKVALNREASFPPITGHLSMVGGVLVLNSLKYLNSSFYAPDKINAITTKDNYSKGFLQLFNGCLATDMVSGNGYWLNFPDVYTDPYTCRLYAITPWFFTQLIRTFTLPDTAVDTSSRTPVVYGVWFDVYDGDFYLAYLSAEQNEGEVDTLTILKNGATWKTLSVGNSATRACRFFVFPGEEFLAAYKDNGSWWIYTSREAWKNTYKIAGTGNVFPQKLRDGILYKTNDTSLSPSEQYRKIDLNLTDTLISSGGFWTYDIMTGDWYTGYVDDFLKRITPSGKEETWWYANWKVV